MIAYFIVRQRWRREEEETRLMYQFVENIIGRSLCLSITQTLNCLTLSSLPESNLEPINVVVPFYSVDETLVCDHSNESY